MIKIEMISKQCSKISLFCKGCFREEAVKLTCTVGENIIATTKIRNDYGAIQSFIFPILR
jgi:hypothetical protein